MSVGWIHTPESQIPYQFVSTRRRSITIRIDRLGEVVVRAPRSTSAEYLSEVLQKKASWINKKRQAIMEARSRLNPRYDEGGEFLFLGEKRILNVMEHAKTKPQIELENDRWVLEIPSWVDQNQRPHIVKEMLIDWYRLQAEEYLGGRVFNFSRVMGLEPLKITVKTQKTMWGSCDFRKKAINLNWQIMMMPPHVIDYVIVHELCHLEVPNHSKVFWKKVARFLPDYDERKIWIKKHHAELYLP